MVNYFALTSLTNGFISILLGVFILSRNFKEEKYWTYSLLCFAMSFWAFSYFFWQISSSAKAALFWCRMLMAGAIFTPFIYLHHLCAALLHNYNKVHLVRKIIKVGYVAAVIFLIWDLTPYFVVSVEAKSIFKYWPNPGILFHIFLLPWSCYVFYTIYVLYDFHKREKNADLKRRTRLILFGTVLVWLGSAFNNFLLWYDINVPPWGNGFMSIYLAIVGYAIFKYKWLDIEVIIKKSLVFAGLLASVLGILVLPALIIQEYLFRQASFVGRLIGLTISGMIIILTVRRTENFLINVTDKYLFQKKYDYKELLRTFTQDVLTIIDLDKLINQTVEKLNEIIKITNSSMILSDDETQRFNLVASRGIANKKFSIAKPNSLLSFFNMTGGYILKSQEGPNSPFPDDIRNALTILEAELLVPLILHEKLIGVVSFGKKKSDELYSEDDIAILLPLARTLAIAISNARLFDQLSKTQAEAAQREKMAVIGTLSAGINHEICNPLGIARGQCEAYLLNVRDGLYKNKTNEELLKKAEDIMQKVIKETDRATVITKKLSTFAKPAKGELQPVDIKSEIDEVLGLVSYELRLEKIEIEKSFNGESFRIIADKKQIQEIFFNVIRNAGQAIGERGKITISASNYDGMLAVDIKDTGHGVPQDKIKELFNPFFTTKAPGKGTGLGLFIVKQVVERNGGKIYLKETKVGEGSTFTVEFPVANRNTKVHV